MPNADLADFMTSTCTRRRYSEVWEGGESSLVHEDLPGIPCGIKPMTDRLRGTGYGVVPESDFLATFHPEADVCSPRVEAAGDGDGLLGTPTSWDALLVTGGPYAGEVLRCGFVHVRELVPSRRAEATRLQQLPASTPG